MIKIPDKSSLRQGGFILAHSLRGQPAVAWGRGGEGINSRQLFPAVSTVRKKRAGCWCSVPDPSWCHPQPTGCCHPYLNQPRNSLKTPLDPLSGILRISRLCQVELSQAGVGTAEAQPHGKRAESGVRKALELRLCLACGKVQRSS